MTTPARLLSQTPDRPLEIEDLERFRAYLALLARLEVAPRLRDKVDLSGVVQQTLLEAHQGLLEHPRAERSAPEVAGWLRSILSNNLADVLRKLTAQKRDFRREWSLEGALDQSASRVEQWLAAEQSSPSCQAQRHEEAIHKRSTSQQIYLQEVVTRMGTSAHRIDNACSLYRPRRNPCDPQK